MDTLAERWTRLLPHVTATGPFDGRARPTVILFHGCGGVRPHLPLYAKAARALGWRACIVDSYTPRGWGRMFGVSMVCSGLAFRGHERGGDVLAAIKGISARPEVDARRVVVAGWSHGGWSIMEALSAARATSGELGLADPGNVDLSGVKGAFLVYPYVGPLAMNRVRPWRHRPNSTLAVIARHDHLTTVQNAERVFQAQRDRGARIATWVAEGTHAFDEPTTSAPMRHDPGITRESVERFSSLLRTL